jgi:hypothetical protein
MPFENKYGLIACKKVGVASHSYFGNAVEVVSWRPSVISGGFGLSRIMKEFERFSVVCNPVIWDGLISFTACILENDKPASYFLYNLDKNGLRKLSGRPLFSGFSIPDQEARISDHNSFKYKKTKVLSKNDQIVRIVPCHDQHLSIYDPLILTILDEGTGGYRSILYKASDGSALRITDSDNKDVYKPTIYNGIMTHVMKNGSERTLVQSEYILQCQ